MISSTLVRNESLQAATAARTVARRAARGIVSVAAGQTALRAVGLIGTTLLARVLSPKDFGVYALTSFAVLQLGAVADLGLGTKLIHDSTEPSLRQKRSVFSIHLALASFLYLIAYCSAPLIARLFSLGAGGGSFCRVVALILLMFPFRAIPTAMLNRRLSFGFIASSEFAGGLVFQAVAVILAFRGCSYWSFGVALLASTVVRTGILHFAYPWRIGFSLDVAFLRSCIRFGSAFQFSSLTSIFRDNIINFLGGPLFGPAPVGLLSWALRLATYTSQTYVGICANVSFPSLSRLRSDPRIFGAMLSKMLRYVNLGTLLSLSVVAGLAPQITHLIFTDKWLPAVPLFYYFAVRMIAGNYTTLLDLALKAQGRPEQSLKIMFCWTALEWTGAIVGVTLFGFTGIAISYATSVWFAVAWLVYEVKKAIAIQIVNISVKPLGAGILTFLLLQFLSAGRITTLPMLLLAASIGVCSFLGVYWFLEGRQMLAEIRHEILVLLGRRSADYVSEVF